LTKLSFDLTFYAGGVIFTASRQLSEIEKNLFGNTASLNFWRRSIKYVRLCQGKEQQNHNVRWLLQEFIQASVLEDAH